MEEMTLRLKIGTCQIGMIIMAGMAFVVLCVFLLIVCQGEPIDPLTETVLFGLFALIILSISVMQVCYVMASKEILRLALQLKIESERRSHCSKEEEVGKISTVTPDRYIGHSVRLEVDLKS